MNAIDFLRAFSEIAVALIGFSGIVLALQSRNKDQQPLKRVAIEMLIGLGSLALVCSLIPQIMLEAGLSPAVVWQTMSIIVIAAAVFGVILRTRQMAQSSGRFDQVVGRDVQALLALGMLVAAANIYYGEFWIFMVNLLVYTIVCTSIFARLLLTGDGD